MGGPNFGPDTKGNEVIDAFPHSIQKKTFILTGMGTSDLSTTTAETLASGDAAALILIGPSNRAIQPIYETINTKYPRVKVIFITADMSKLSSVRGAADVIRKLEVTLDGIVCFPTVMVGEWAVTGDGVERHFGVNYLSHFVLVNRLRGVMPDDGRVVVVGSSIRPDAGAWGFEDVNFDNGKTYHPLDGYAQSMFANVQFVKCLASPDEGRSMIAFAVNPGNTKTNLHTSVSPEQVASWLQRKKEIKQDLPLLLQQAPKSLSQGCATVLRALLDPGLKSQSGAFLDNCQVRALQHIDFPAGEESSRQLWRKSRELAREECDSFA